MVSAGMVSALEELGLGQAFDAVYGSSAAGAINAALLPGRTGADGTTIYFENLNNQVHQPRPAAGRPAHRRSGFPAQRRRDPDQAAGCDRVLSSPAPLTVMATDVTSATRRCGISRTLVLFGAMRARHDAGGRRGRR